ncbi:HipA domain-containing protein [Fulvivirgaceae bacterium PWU4]|uniref:HipA domain-containing protein n=1 Tax=Chryseosolibacter histidini TaxID=2782349 RepID=A0AAP2DIV0_9BACT|nr:HipA domain-containing protein [Chryseosolibacter histidini]
MNCSGCLKQIDNAGFCRKCLQQLFEGKKVEHVLPFNSPVTEHSDLYANAVKRLSISGVQLKYSLRLENNELILTNTNAQYILKPIPVGQFKNLDQAPANEHLTMQVAGQIFKITIPPNAIIHFKDNAPAYLVKRFDVKADGSKNAQEDFAQIAQVTAETHGKNYKYDLSYEEIGLLIKRHIAMYAVELEKFFRLVIFNYIFSNGDAHARNFSAVKTDDGDYILTPAYDLLCTRIHSSGEADMALTLFKDRFTEAYDAHGFYTYDDFLEFGSVLGIKESRVGKIIDEFNGKEERIDQLVDASFLRDDLRAFYKQTYKDKLTRLKVAYSKAK